MVYLLGWCRRKETSRARDYIVDRRESPYDQASIVNSLK